MFFYLFFFFICQSEGQYRNAPQEVVETCNVHGKTDTPCHFSPLAEIPGSAELLENSLTYEGVQWRKIIEWILCILGKVSACSNFSRYVISLFMYLIKFIYLIVDKQG